MFFCSLFYAFCYGNLENKQKNKNKQKTGAKLGGYCEMLFFYEIIFLEILRFSDTLLYLRQAMMREGKENYRVTLLRHFHSQRSEDSYYFNVKKQHYVCLTLLLVWQHLETQTVKAFFVLVLNQPIII